MSISGTDLSLTSRLFKKSLYICNSCTEPVITLCAACYTSGVHFQHEFKFKVYPKSKPRMARKRFKNKPRFHNLVQDGLPSLEELLFHTDDTEILNELDASERQQAFSIPNQCESIPLSESVVNLIPSFKIKKSNHRLLQPNPSQCLICLKNYTLNATIRKLACGHYFHLTCIDGFLLEDYTTCPICGEAAIRQRQKPSLNKPKNNGDVPVTGIKEPLHLEISGFQGSSVKTKNSVLQSVPRVSKRPPKVAPLRRAASLPLASLNLDIRKIL